MTRKGKPRVIWGRKALHPFLERNGKLPEVTFNQFQVLPGIFFVHLHSARHEIDDLEKEHFFLDFFRILAKVPGTSRKSS